ncbi:MAG: DNA recombination protein RmuC [Tannerellaceae bacterium]|jgi:DNA recombination protein RmuC|nr:DNA recombination protein RmuC [Tannerellaceae bacterium]
MIEIITCVFLGLLALAVVVNIVLAAKKGMSGEVIDLLARMKGNLSRVDSLIREEFGRNREEGLRSSKETREELSKSFTVLGENLMKVVAGLSGAQKDQFELFSLQLKELQERLDKSGKESRVEQSNSLKSFEERFAFGIKYFNEALRQKFDDLVTRQEGIKHETEEKLREIRDTVEGQLTRLQEDNNKKLEEMRKTVDEKLQESVEKRFNESFRLINERLEAVHKGLGEMQTLATGVGDLKKVLTNVKTRGTFGEVQLGAILEQVLSPEQYIRNNHPDNDRKVVEYAIKLPGKENDGEHVLLPIDSKFPVEDYQRLLDAYENNTDTVEYCRKQFEGSVKSCAKDIREKYINPPRTTDFALLFVPAEGLYAEILRRPGFAEMLQQTFRVIVVGPTNLVAFLNSLQMGFRALAIEKRSSEVWEILGAVKTEFGNFGAVLGKTRKKLQEAANVIDKASIRSRAIERKLKTVQELPQSESAAVLGEAIDLAEEQEEDSDEDEQDA